MQAKPTIDRPQRGPWPQPLDMGVGWMGAALVYPLEHLSLRPASLGLAVTSVALFAALGSAIGLCMAAGNAAAARLASPWWRACVRALPSLLATIPVGLRLFDGAKASTLPGAAWAPVWFPAFCLLALALALLVGEIGFRTPGRKLALALALLLGAGALDWINRKVQPSGYFDVHTLLLVSTCVAAGLGARNLYLGLTRPRGSASLRATRLGRVAAVLTAAGFGVALLLGLQTTASRWQVATQGLHTRLLVRTVHGVFDFDRDGSAHVLGGGDCNGLNAAVHPGAREVSHNGIDENCDGADDDVAAAALAAQRNAQRTQSDDWRTSATVEQQLVRTSKMNLILISVDALRADVLNESEASQTQYPHLSRLLGESLHFTRAFAPSAGTDLSMSGVLTGQVDPYATSAPTLAEALKQSGRRTYAVVPSEVVRYVGKAVLTRGVDEYKELVNDLYERDVGSHSTSARTTELGSAFLASHQANHGQEPFFLWLHYFDVHEHDELRPSDKRVKAVLQSAGELARPEKYRRLVTLVDEQVGVFLQDLERRGWQDNTVVVLLSDHGEGLGEDRRLPEHHGRFVYNALVHVPVAIRVPGLAARKIEHPVSLLDVYPTLVELLTGASVPVDGNSALAHVLEGAPASLKQRMHPLPLNESDQFGVIAWPYKLLVRRRENISELYDLRTDFSERQNLSAQEPARVQALLATYAAMSHVDVDRTSRGRSARNKTALRGAQSNQVENEQNQR